MFTITLAVSTHTVQGAIGDAGIADLLVRERQLGAKDGGAGLVAILADSAHSVRAFARQCAFFREIRKSRVVVAGEAPVIALIGD